MSFSLCEMSEGTVVCFFCFVFFSSFFFPFSSSFHSLTQLNSAIKMIKGRCSKLVLKHDASRIIQTCVKHGTPTQRQEIIEELKDHLLPITKSRYGKFLATKLFMYANPAQKTVLLSQLKGVARKMMKQKDAADVLEYAYSEVMNAAERHRVLFEIYAPDMSVVPDAPVVSLADMLKTADVLRLKNVCDDLANLISRWINKELLRNSVVHALMWEYVQCVPESRKEALLSSLKELTMHFLHTRDGSRVAMWIATQGNAKDRKAMMKSLKPFAVQTALDEFGCMVLVRLLDVTDDTKSSAAALLRPLLQDAATIESLVCSPHASLVFLHIFSPAEPKYFTQVQREALQQPSATSKKQADVRQKELLAHILDPLSEFLTGSASSVTDAASLSEDKPLNNKWCANIIYECVVAGGDEKESARQLLQAILQLVERHVDVLDLFSTSRLLKRLVVTAINTASEGQKSFARSLWSAFEKRGLATVHELISKKGAGFVVVALLENELTSSKVISFLKGSKKDIASIDSPAAKIIAKKLA